MELTLSLGDTEATEALGYHMADRLLSLGIRRAFFAFRGDLGAGKTSFSRGFVRRAAPGDRAKSPTYNLLFEYRSGPVPVFHFDLYRLEGEDDLESIGYFDIIEEDGFVLCEWSERIVGAIPEDAVLIELLRTEQGDGRLAKVKAPDKFAFLKDGL